MGNEPKYDPRLHITAGEIRDLGFVLDDRIPDCAWTERSGLTNPEVHCVDPPKGARTLPVATISMEVKKPFNWFEVSGTIKLDEG